MTFIIDDMTPAVARRRAMAFGRVGWSRHLIEAFPAHLHDIANTAYDAGVLRRTNDKRNVIAAFVRRFVAERKAA